MTRTTRYLLAAAATVALGFGAFVLDTILDLQRMDKERAASIPPPSANDSHQPGDFARFAEAAGKAVKSLEGLDRLGKNLPGATPRSPDSRATEESR